MLNPLKVLPPPSVLSIYLNLKMEPQINTSKQCLNIYLSAVIVPRVVTFRLSKHAFTAIPIAFPLLQVLARA